MEVRYIENIDNVKEWVRKKGREKTDKSVGAVDICI